MISLRAARVQIERMRTIDRMRRSLSQLSSELLSTSKRAIFAMHRQDEDGARREISSARELFHKAQRLVKTQITLAQEGPWRAAQEEYVEASLVIRYLATGKLSLANLGPRDPEVLFGALSDVVGEMVRYAVWLASEGQGARVAHILRDAQHVVSVLLQLDATGSLRTKIDQAKQHLRKLEEICYDIQLHQRPDTTSRSRSDT